MMHPKLLLVLKLDTDEYPNDGNPESADVADPDVFRFRSLCFVVQ